MASGSSYRKQPDSSLPVYSYDPVPGVPPVTTMRMGRNSSAEPELVDPHSHSFLVLGYFEEDGGWLRIGSSEWQIEAGDVYIVAPGEIIDPRGLEEARGWAVFFTPEILESQTPGSFLSWRIHPLLFPFVRGRDGGVQRMKVPLADRKDWAEHLQALETELGQRRDGYCEAVQAHLTLLLISISRQVADIVEDLRLNKEPLLAEVFSFIEERFHERISLKDVAWAVSLSPGHLTTVMRRKTGRTVQEWIAERRLAEARRQLVETNLSVEEVGQMVGYNDPVYFVRSFRRAHGTTPLGWRRAGRPQVGEGVG
jgi:AraC family transcriptional regulator, transcriptional activator of pobA